ncbi:MAG: CBS domain-containing protein [Candidatus Dormibacteraeota bacterium]|nr:CBS domain-containing protein [Candidatus Dormibacteraeota bacterium]
MRVSDAMSRELNRTGPETTIADAASLMSQRRIGSTLVCRGDRLLGIFTERDILRAVSHDASAMHDSLEHWMTRRPRTVAPDTDLDEALRIMVEGHFRHLPVQEEGQLVGMLSMRDVSRVSLEQDQGAGLT